VYARHRQIESNHRKLREQSLEGLGLHGVVTRRLSVLLVESLDSLLGILLGPVAATAQE
jgi:hypothetical protein